jgi:hypothetical protein
MSPLASPFVSSRFWPRASASALLGLAWALAACGSKSGDDDAASARGGSGSIVVGNGGTNPGTSGSGSGASAGSTGTCGDTSVNGCAGVAYEAEGGPLDIYIMFDQSGSMLNDVGGLTRLEAVQRATAQFLRDPESAGIGVGIGYFGTQPIGQVSCDPNVYRTPDVPITADHEQVVRSLNGRMPTGETPTSAALSGACSYAQEYRRQNPGHAVVNLLVTDGKPEAPVSCGSGGCCPTLDEATRVASDCLNGNPGIPTYVLGVGPNLDNLGRIAQAGGTRSAYLVGDQDVTAKVLAALNSIRGDAKVPCNLEIPTPASGAPLDYNQVNVLLSPASCAYEPVYRVRTAAECTVEGGWHYDNPEAPTFIALCAASCDRVRHAGSSLKFSIGCATVEPPVR